jgi:hypothetical protein
MEPGNGGASAAIKNCDLPIQNVVLMPKKVSMHSSKSHV